MSEPPYLSPDCSCDARQGEEHRGWCDSWTQAPRGLPRQLATLGLFVTDSGYSAQVDGVEIIGVRAGPHAPAVIVAAVSAYMRSLVERRPA